MAWLVRAAVSRLPIVAATVMVSAIVAVFLVRNSMRGTLDSSTMLERHADVLSSYSHSDTTFFKTQQVVLKWPLLTPIVPPPAQHLHAAMSLRHRCAARCCLAINEVVMNVSDYF